MDQAITFGFVTAPDDKVGLLFEMTERLDKAAKEVPGVESATLWMDLDLPERYAVFVHADSTEAADTFANLVGATDIFDAAIEQLEVPPDIRRMETLLRYGASIGQMSVGQVLSLSIRQAQPGQTGELMDDVVSVFQGLKYIDGFLGAAIGPNSALREEIVGIALWTDRKPFDESVSRGSFYEIRLFERIA